MFYLKFLFSYLRPSSIFCRRDYRPVLPEGLGLAFESLAPPGIVFLMAESSAMFPDFFMSLGEILSCLSGLCRLLRLRIETIDGDFESRLTLL